MNKRHRVIQTQSHMLQMIGHARHRSVGVQMNHDLGGKERIPYKEYLDRTQERTKHTMRCSTLSPVKPPFLSK